MNKKRDKEIEDIILEHLKWCDEPREVRRYSCKEIIFNTRDILANSIQAHIFKEYVRRDEVGIDGDKLKDILSILDPGKILKKDGQIYDFGYILKAIASSKDVLTFNKDKK